jgi:hypothetical protein
MHQMGICTTNYLAFWGGPGAVELLALQHRCRISGESNGPNSSNRHYVNKRGFIRAIRSISALVSRVFLAWARWVALSFFSVFFCVFLSSICSFFCTIASLWASSAASLASSIARSLSASSLLSKRALLMVFLLFLIS